MEIRIYFSRPRYILKFGKRKKVEEQTLLQSILNCNYRIPKSKNLIIYLFFECYSSLLSLQPSLFSSRINSSRSIFASIQIYANRLHENKKPTRAYKSYFQGQLKTIDYQLQKYMYSVSITHRLLKKCEAPTELIFNFTSIKKLIPSIMHCEN